MFVIPYAGGSYYSMRGIEDELKNHFDVLILELPGRGKRIKEPLISNIDLIVNDLFLKIEPLILKYQSYFIYGHSMGTLLGYLLIQKIITKNNKLPIHFFVSGCGGPSKEQEDKKRHLLPSNKFREILMEYGGSPKEVVEDEVLMDFFEPILRSDFKIIDSYLHKNQNKFKVPITGFFGSEEKTTVEEMELWQEETQYQISLFKFKGNHFFIFNYWKEIGKTIRNIIDNKKLVKYHSQT